MPRFVFALVGCAVIACTKSEPRARGDARLERTGDMVPLAKAPVPDPLPAVAAHRVRWSPELVSETLKAAGLELEGTITPVSADFLSPHGHRMMLRAPDGARAEVRAFIYGDAGAVGQDLAGVDTIRVARRGTFLEWRIPVQLVTNNNLVAIVLSSDAALRRKIRAALTAQQTSGIP